MRKNQINFRTKTQVKAKSNSLSQQFVTIQKALNEYQKKKFRPKMQNFRYMSTRSIGKRLQKSKFLQKKDNDYIYTQKMYGPMPQLFNRQKNQFKAQPKYDVSQITLASSQQKQAYVQMSKIRNRQKRRKLKYVIPGQNQTNLQKLNINLIELLGRQIAFLQSSRNPEQYQIQKDSNYFQMHRRQISSSKTQIRRESSYKKYAETEIQQFLQGETNLTMSQKRRVKQFKKKQNNSLQKQSEEHKIKRRVIAIKGKQDHNQPMRNNEQTCVKNHTIQQKQRPMKAKTKQAYNGYDPEQWDIRLSNKGWITLQNNDSNIMAPDTQIDFNPIVLVSI